MICSLRNSFLLLVVLAVSASLCLAQTTRIENDNPAATYTGVWYLNTNVVHSGGTAVLAVDPGASVSLNFNGTAISWIAYRDEWSGLAAVILDGQQTATIDTYLAPGQARTVAYSIADLLPGDHSLTIQALGTHNQLSGGSWVWLDSFDVGQASTLQSQTPILTINLPAFCVGGTWAARVSNALPNASVSLTGTTNGQSWVIAQWATTDASGSLSQGGTFGPGTQGLYTLTVGIAGTRSNTVSFSVTNCIQYPSYPQ